jgi:hypothetical protein
MQRKVWPRVRTVPRVGKPASAPTVTTSSPPVGTEEPDVLMRRFLGREVSDAAFFRELRLTSEPTAGRR